MDYSKVLAYQGIGVAGFGYGLGSLEEAFLRIGSPAELVYILRRSATILVRVGESWYKLISPAVLVMQHNRF